MDPITIAAITKAAIGGAQLIGGGISALTQKRTPYEIPEEVERNLAMSSLRMRSDMPGYAKAKDDIGTVTSNQIAAAQSSGDALAALPSIQAQASKALLNLQQSSAEYKDRQFKNYQDALSTKAAYKDKAFQYNVAGPEADRFSESRDIFGAGLTNVMSGLDSYGIASTITGNNNFFAKNDNRSLLDKQSIQAFQVAQAIAKYFQTP